MSDPLQTIPAQLEAELRAAMVEKKCQRCGCFQDAVATLRGSALVREALPVLLDQASACFEERRYDCLGCEVCWPAAAMNLAAEIDAALADAAACPATEPVIRAGWPPLPGDYRVVRYRAPVAVCTLNSDHLVTALADTRTDGLAIVGGLHTENLGIEHLIRNLLPNPYVRFLLVVGEDTRKQIGHLPGQSLVSLMREGLDERGRIRGARGKRPVVKNISSEHVELFRRRVRIIDRIGETDPQIILEAVKEAAANDPGAATERVPEFSIEIERASEPPRLTLDPKGYFVVYPDRTHGRLVLEHYTNQGVLSRMFEANGAAALYATVIDRELISRLDHAAYLGRELARAEQALCSGEQYVQDRAPDALDASAINCADAACACKGGA